MILSDMRDRGIPWTQLILRYGVLNDDLNLRAVYRLSVMIAYLALTTVVLGFIDTRFFTATPLLIGGLAVLNWRYYAFFYRKRGCWFAIRVFPLHLLHHLYNGCSFAIGSALFLAARWLGVGLRGALPLDPWSPPRMIAPATDCHFVLDRTTPWRPAATPGEIRAFSTCRNECLRLPAFLRHYRGLGVDRFFIVGFKGQPIRNRGHCRISGCRAIKATTLVELI